VKDNLVGLVGAGIDAPLSSIGVQTEWVSQGLESLYGEPKAVSGNASDSNGSLSLKGATLSKKLSRAMAIKIVDKSFEILGWNNPPVGTNNGSINTSNGSNTTNVSLMSNQAGPAATFDLNSTNLEGAPLIRRHKMAAGNNITLTEGTGVLKSLGGMCIDKDLGASTTDDSGLLQLSKCVPSYTSQQWTYDSTAQQIKSKTNECLDAIPVAYGLQLVFRECNSSNSQRWAADEALHIRNLGQNHLCLHATSGTTDGSALEMRTCADDDNQHWTFELLEELSPKGQAKSHAYGITSGDRPFLLFLSLVLLWQTCTSMA